MKKKKPRANFYSIWELKKFEESKNIEYIYIQSVLYVNIYIILTKLNSTSFLRICIILSYFKLFPSFMIFWFEEWLDMLEF